ncbi:MAG: T9SS type A sorting domain-containing protein, partial [Ignavibacteriaceae bacterium]|nr:T9SS type A sorting domain-containing protein [Ignavibacteriaceae bacterium]
TTIQYQIPVIASETKQSAVKLIVYDILGNEVAILVNEQKEPGFYEVSWNASNLASGVYIYRLQTGSFVSVKKMMLLR